MNGGDADPVDWSQFYQDMASGRRDRPLQSHATASVVVEDVAAAAASGSRGKPARKRSRTSRRAPTTLLNTDTSNFRAMVQQFTGVPSVAPYTTSYMPAGGATTLNFGIGFHNPASGQSPAILRSYGVLETQQNQYQYQQQQHSQYRQPPQQQEMVGFGIGENMEDDRRQVGLGLPEEFFLDGIGGPSENSRGGGYFL